jgi:hypothetical protein
LLSDEEDINLNETNSSVLNNQFITIWNCTDIYNRCFKFDGFDGHSIIKYEEIDGKLGDDDKRTYFRKNNKVGAWGDNEYTLFFPDVKQTEIKCGKGTHVVAASFGCFATGNQNSVMGFNSFAAGKGNRATGNYSTAIGLENNAGGVDSIALGEKAEALKNK